MKMATSLDPMAALAVSQAYSASRAVEVEREKTRREREATERQAQEKLETEAKSIAEAARIAEEKVFRPRDGLTDAQNKVRIEIERIYKPIEGEFVQRAEIIAIVRRMRGEKISQQTTSQYITTIFTCEALSDTSKVIGLRKT